MPAGMLFVTVTLPYNTGIPEDVSINTFALLGDATPSDAAMVAVADDLARFYNVAAGSPALSIAELMAHGLDRGANKCEVAFYDGTSLPMGSPVGSKTFTLGATTANTGASDHPDEVAITLSLSAGAEDEPEESGSTRPAARHRGRIYLGPWSTAVGASVNSHLRPSANTRQAICAAADRLADELLADAYVWSVWSRANDSTYGIQNGWVDDAFDTQRRRGVAPTARSTFTV